jgi:hypothetical protein
VARYTGFQWLLPLVHDRAATSPVIVARAANTNTAVSRKTTHKRLPHWPKPQRKPRPDRPSRPSPLPHLPASTKRTSLGRPPLLAALSRGRGRLARSVAAEALRIERIVRINGLWPAVWACRRNIGFVIGPRSPLRQPIGNLGFRGPTEPSPIRHRLSGLWSSLLVSYT